MSEPKFFRNGAAFRRWLERNHATVTELTIGFYKVGSSKKGITYREALDEALCFGWIDGVRRGLDDQRFVQRFTPRRAKSYWSRVNRGRMEQLFAEGRVAPSGAAAFERRPRETGKYSFESEPAEFGAEFAAALAAKPKAAAFWAVQPPSYRRLMTFWVMSAKREETRRKRFAQLLAESAKGRRLGQLAPKPSPEASPAPRAKTARAAERPPDSNYPITRSFRSLISQRFHRIDARGAMSGGEAGGKRHD